MSRKRRTPVVAICGRPNVGKSTLFNRIVGRQAAIVHAEEGITRDRHISEAEYAGRRFRVVDTGGIVESPIDPIVRKMQEQVRRALYEADVIIFVLDGQQEITRIDEEIRDELFKYGKPVVVAVNKLDNPQLQQNKNEFYVLGIGEPIAISSGHGLGVSELLDEVVKRFPENGAPATTGEGAASVTKVAVIGKPNVGKSSFINAILNEERTIVHETPGTTRDSIDIEFEWKGKQYLLIDTAGLRKKAGIKAEVERFSVARTLRTVRRADVCLVLIDAVEGITEQDKRIIGYVREQGRGIVLVWTKWDLVEDKAARFKAIPEEIDRHVPYLKYAPFVTISNVTRQRIFTVFEYIDRVAEQVHRRISTGELNRFFDELKGQTAPAMHKGKTAKILYATQTDVRPTTIVLFVNQKRLFHFSYLRYIENRLREKFGFEGVPIHLELREGERPTP